jgi:hypothetical protein
MGRGEGLRQFLFPLEFTELQRVHFLKPHRAIMTVRGVRHLTTALRMAAMDVRHLVALSPLFVRRWASLPPN